MVFDIAQHRYRRYTCVQHWVQIIYRITMLCSQKIHIYKYTYVIWAVIWFNEIFNVCTLWCCMVTTVATTTMMTMAVDGTFKSQHDYLEREWSEMSLKKERSGKKYQLEIEAKEKNLTHVDTKLRLNTQL